METTTVYRTTPVGTVVETSVELTIDNRGINAVTVTEHRGSEPPPGQLLPSFAEDTVLVRDLSPAPGVLTVTEYVMTAEPPADRFPVQLNAGAV